MGLPPVGAVDVGATDEIDLSYEGVQSRFFVATGKGACIVDERLKSLMSVRDFSTTVGNEVYRKFINDPQTRRIHKDNIVFDPTGCVQKRGYFNLFNGMSVSPKNGDCSKLLELLYLICEQNDDVYRWVLSWFAYPLQNSGAKMRTAIVIHGGEGVGKNLFLSAIQGIYGEYSAIITQTDIESPFNGWASCKLFVIGNEVVSRQEMYHKKGVIKNMITEPFWNINEKNINVRREANHANFVFTSNHLQPVSPDRDDRRYQVLWTPPKRDKSFYKAVADERDNGGVEALYYHLMNMDLGEFDEYTEPVMTRAKEDLIRLSMKSDEKFISYWLSGDLGMSVMPCLTGDLYKFYQRWCKHEGEKFIVTMTEFGTRIGKQTDQLMRWRNERYLVGHRERKGTFVVHFDTEQPQGVKKIDWLTDCRKQFLDAVNAWLDSDDA